MKNSKLKKQGWTMVELVVALVILSILLGLSIQIIKTKKIRVLPFTYSGVENLINGNNIIMESMGEFALPEPSATGPDPYCLKLGDVFNTVTPMTCNVTCSGTPLTCTPSVTNQFNFQVANQVSYSGLNNPWTTDGLGQSIKTIILDINGGAGTNGTPKCPTFSKAGTPLANGVYIGKECFQLNVYKNGSVLPTGKCLSESNTLVDCRDTNFPFGYDVWEVRAPTEQDITDNKCFADDPDCRVTERLFPNVSYSQALCVSDPNTDDETRIIPVADCTAKGYTLNARCGTDSSQFCLMKPAKPAMAVGFRY